MSNHHLRNKDLSLKAKGLLSQMLSLPENWDYTLKGLSLINRESIDAIRTAVWELEKAGYNHPASRTGTARARWPTWFIPSTNSRSPGQRQRMKNSRIGKPGVGKSNIG